MIRNIKSKTSVDMSPLTCRLKDLPRIILKRVDKTEDEKIWDYLVSQYHYLGYKKMFGYRIKYLVMSEDRIIAALSFNQGTKKIKVRDLFIQWSKENREKNLKVIANNNRFLIMPWVKIKYLASHILSKAIRIVRRDWKNKYGVELLLLETFVDKDKYNGTCYLAANWTYIGSSRGYSKVRDGSYAYHGNKKGVYIYILQKDFRKILKCEEKPVKKKPVNHHVSRKHIDEEVFTILAHKIYWEPKLLEKLGIITDNVAALSQKFAEYFSSFKNSFNHINQVSLGAVYLQGLMNNGIERKSIEPVALKYLGCKGVRPLQQFISRSPWHDKTMESKYNNHLSNRINDPESGMFTIDESDFLKKGKHSAGVARQYCGVVGKVENCQAGIFIGYASEKGYGLINSQLYVPKKWFGEDYDELRVKCKFPEGIEYKSKNSICLELLDKARKSGDFSAKWIGCDSAFGSNHKFRWSISEMGYYYFANIRVDMGIWPIMPQMRPSKRKNKDGDPIENWPISKPISVFDFVMQDTSMWNQVVMGEGSKGPIISYIKTHRVYENIDGLPGNQVWLYVRKFENGKLNFAFCNAPSDTPHEVLDKMALSRWSIEQCFEECKTELGMDHYEVRSYHGWQRHMLLTMVAHEFLCEVQNMFKKSQNEEDYDPIIITSKNKNSPQMTEIHEISSNALETSSEINLDVVSENSFSKKIYNKTDPQVSIESSTSLCTDNNLPEFTTSTLASKNISLSSVDKENESNFCEGNTIINNSNTNNKKNK